MNNSIEYIGFGGSCHWCTEAIFRSLRGVEKVEQGWIASAGEADSFSEAVIVHYDSSVAPLNVLVAVHLHTHSCTSRHSMRDKYRSAVYIFDEAQAGLARKAITGLQAEFDAPIITAVLPFVNFRLNEAQYLDYYYRAPDKPFCRNIVQPKLRSLLEKFSAQVRPGRIPGAQDDQEQVNVLHPGHRCRAN